MQDSPAYRLNHEEVIKALEEGIAFAENLDPVEAVPDEYGHVQAMVFARARRRRRRARRAAGAHRARGRRHRPERHLREGAPGTFELDGQKFFQGFRAVKDADGRFALEPDAERLLHVVPRRRPLRQLLRRQPPALQRQRRQGDGVGQARLSARRRAVRGRDRARSIRRRSRSASARGRRWSARLDDELLARVERVVRLTPTIVEVIVRAPAAARHFHPGQFYRLQNFERCSPHVAHRRSRASLLMEGIALTGAWVDREQGLLSLITLEMGVSSRLCAYLQPGEPVVVMGPTGTPTEIPGARSGAPRRRRPRQRRAVLDRQGAQGAAATACIYFAGYRNGDDLFKREEIEAATDQVIWATDIGAGDRAAPPAGRALPRQHRAGDGRLRGGPARRRSVCRSPTVSRDHRHRLRPHDERGARCAARRAARRT